jgi:hypothetical protein
MPLIAGLAQVSKKYSNFLEDRQTRTNDASNAHHQ